MKTLYQCEVCKIVYGNKADALKCESIGAMADKPTFEVGDFVITGSLDYGPFGWFDGDETWVIKCPKGLHSKKDWDGKYYKFIYLVTAITPAPREPHRTQVHLETRAMTGKSGYRSGVTYMTDHVTPTAYVSSLPKGEIVLGTTFSNII